MLFPGVMAFQKHLHFLFRACRAVDVQVKKLPGIRNLPINYLKLAFRKTMPLPWQIRMHTGEISHFTAGPVYLGAVICFLFILGMVYVKSWHKWWILSICIAGIVLAWGRHFVICQLFFI